MSVTAPRPPRYTGRLSLPIPGDEGVADYVTYTGAICDQLDAVAAEQVPVLASPSDLSLYVDPPDGATVDLVTWPLTSGAWRLRYRAAILDAYKWIFLGGTPMQAFDGAQASINPNLWTPLQPGMTPPRPGFYRVQVRAQVQVATGQAAYIALSSTPLTPGVVVPTIMGSGSILSGTGGWGLILYDGLVDLSAVPSFFPTIQATTFANIIERTVTMWPIRVV